MRRYAAVVFEPLEKIQEFADAVHTVIDDPRAGSIRVEARELEDPEIARTLTVELVSNADEFEGVYIGIYDPEDEVGALAVILDQEGCTALVEALDASAAYLAALQ